MPKKGYPLSASERPGKLIDHQQHMRQCQQVLVVVGQVFGLGGESYHGIWVRGWIRTGEVVSRSRRSPEGELVRWLLAVSISPLWAGSGQVFRIEDGESMQMGGEVPVLSPEFPASKHLSGIVRRRSAH